MPAVLTSITQIQCSHGAVVSHVPSSPKVTILGNPVLVATDLNSVAGCAFTLPGGAYSPCVTVRWTAPSTRVKVFGQPVVLQSSAGIGTAATQAPQGPAIVGATQPKVQAI